MLCEYIVDHCDCNQNAFIAWCNSHTFVFTGSKISGENLSLSQRHTPTQHIHIYTAHTCRVSKPKHVFVSGSLLDAILVTLPTAV